MDEKIIVRSNNDYAKKLKDTATTATVVSAVVFALLMIFFNNNKFTILLILDICAFIASVCLLVFAISIQKTEIIVSDKRVYGITSFGKRVDLPFDSISAVGISAFKGIAVGTSSGQIVFKGIGNRDEIHSVIGKLLVERQEKKATSTPVTTVIAPQSSNAEELKKYKDLLDDGVITQEEFDEKKKQLLNL